MSGAIAADLSAHAHRRAAKFPSELDEDWARHIAAVGSCRHAAKHSDILPVDYFGVREDYGRLKGLEKAPPPRQMREIGEAWSPWRTVPCLWRLPAR